MIEMQLTCLYILLITVIPVISEVNLTISPHNHVVEENKPFTLACNAIETEKNEIKGNIYWKLHPHNGTVEIDIQNTPETRITAIKSEDKRSIRSSLSVSKPPLISTSLSYYCCFQNCDSPKIFSLVLLKESSIPNIIVINSTTLTELSFIEARFGETVPLACQLSYENSGPTDKAHFKLSVSWRKDGNNRSIAEEPIQYKAGNNVFTYNHAVTIGKSSDGGTYWCQSHFIFYQISYERNASVELKISPKLNGDREKEVTAIAGCDVALQCDIEGYPIKYEWTFENGIKVTGDIESRFLAKGSVLSIHNINDRDTKKYICIGNYSDGKELLNQSIVLRVEVSADENASDWQLPVVVASIVIFVVAIAGFCYCCCKHVKKRSFDLPTTQVTVHPPSSTIQEVTVHPSSPTIQDRPWFQMLRQRQLAE